LFSGVFLLGARQTEFTHGTELGWALAYLVPLVLSCLAITFGLFHFRAGRWKDPLAWLPVIPGVLIFGFVVAYLFFDAFRQVPQAP